MPGPPACRGSEFRCIRRVIRGPRSCLQVPHEELPELPLRNPQESPPDTIVDSSKALRVAPKFLSLIRESGTLIKSQSCLRNRQSHISEALRIVSKSPEVTLRILGAASEWYPFSLVGKFYSASDPVRKRFWTVISRFFGHPQLVHRLTRVIHRMRRFPPPHPQRSKPASGQPRTPG